MDYRRGYDYQDSMMYGRENQNFRGQMPYGRENQMMNRPYGFDNWGQMSYNPFFEDRDDAEDERDLAYMREMHPEQVRTIMRHVEELCDRMDYEGSMMYDEYPDRLMLRNMCNEIYEKVKYMDTSAGSGMMPEQNMNMRRSGNAGSMMPENNSGMAMSEANESSMGMMTDESELQDDMTAMQFDDRRRGQCVGRDCNPFRNLIEVLLHQEMRRRRHRRRSRRRYWKNGNYSKQDSGNGHVTVNVIYGDMDNL